MFGDTRDQISETEDEYENGIPTTWKASEDNVRKIGTNPWFQDMQQNYYKQLQYTIANTPEHKKLDVANQLSVDSTLSLLYGMTPTEAHENRNRLMYDIMGQQMDDKSWLQAFSDSFSSFDRNFVTSLKAYQLMFIKDPAKRVKLQQEIDDRNLKEATVYKDLSNRNWLSKFVVFPGANILNQVMITLASALVGGAVGTSIAGAPALGLTTTLPATTGVALIDGQLRDVSAKGALGWVLAKAGVPGIASSAGPQAIGSTIGTIASTVATMYPMAAGRSYLEMKSYVDAKGNHMSDDIAVPFAMLAGFGETALEFLTQTPVTDRVMKGVLGRTMPNLHEASRYAWGTMFKYSGNVILDAAKSIHNESFEEGVQQFYDEFTYWVAKFASNQTNETRFDMDWKSELWDIFKDGVKTYVQSLGPMTLAAGGDAVLNLGMGANITRKMQAEADSMFADSKQGVAVDINSVFIGKHEMGGNRISDESDVNTDLNGSEKSDANTDLSSEDDEYIRIHHLDETGRTKSADEIKAGYLNQKREPITVVQDERTGAYIPLNDSDKDVVSDLQNAGVGAVKVRVVSAKDGTMESSEYTGETVNRLALQLGASIAKDDQNTIVLPDQESVDAVAQDLRENETVYEEDVDTKTGGPVTLYLLDEDGKSVKITLSAEQELQTIEPDQKYIDRIEAPHIASTMSLENYARKRERDTVMEKVKAGMGGGDPLRVTEMADTILTVSGLTHIPSSTLADNIRVATDATEEDEWNALMTAAKERGYSGDAAVEFAEKQAGKVNGWKENNGGGRYTIHLTKYATESTIVHEMGHIMRELLGNDKERLAEFESIYGKKGSTWVTDVVDNKDGTYSLGGLSFASYQAAYKKAVENEERFANDFVRYMKEGVAPTEGLRDVFSRMKTILKGLLGIYAQDLDPAVRKAFEDLYAQNDREKAGGAGTGTLFEPAASQAEYGETEERLRADPKNFDGEGRHLAPNGKPSRLTYRQWVTARTPAFKAWFGDWEHDPENASKVVDENGEPKVVYHNTTENFSVFREGKNGGLSGNGIYFSEYPLWQFGPVQIQAFLDIRHPITSETELDGMHEINSSGLPTRFIPDVLDRFPQFDGVMNHDEMTVRSSNQVKSATDNNGDFAIENENILFQTASDYVVRRASDIMDMALDPGIDAKTLRKKLGLNKNNKYSVNDIQRALAEFYKRATENRVDFTDLKDPDNIRNFARIYANEIEARLRRMPGETPIGWYSKNVEDALKIYSLVYPELADDNYKYPFLASLAITSQGETVEHNSDVAGRMYEYYKEHGVFPTSKKEIGTTKWGPMAANFEKLNLILSMLDNPGELKIELLKVYSVRNIEKMTGYSVSGESKDEELPLSAIFGPKIGGAFMANLFGDYTRFTMDKWMSRSLYRFTGKNINNDEMSSFLDHAEKLRDELRSTGNDIHYAYTVEGKKFAEIKLDEEYTLDDLMEDDELLKKYADALTKDIYSKTQTVDGETGSYNARLRVPVTTVAKTLSQNKMASESFNSEERQFFRAVSHEIQDILDAENPHDGKHFVEIADIQAIMWYNEKNLYDKIQSQQKTSIGTSYSEAARKFAQKKGVLNEGEINRDTLGSSSGIRPAGQGRDLPVLERDDQPTSLGQVQGDHGAEPEGWRSSTPSVYEWFKSNPKGVRRYLADSRLDHDGQEPARGSYVREHLEGEKRDVWELGLGENPSDKQKKAFGALDRYIKRFRLYFGKNKYTAKAIYSPSRQFRANLVFAQNKTDVALNLNDMYEIEASDSGLFIDRITAAVQAMKDSGTHPEWMRVDIHDDAYYKGSRLFLNKKGTVGFALHGDDIVSVFSDPSEKKSIYSIIPLAVSEGGRRLDCYAGQLPAMYSKFGFYPVGKYAWNDAYWDPARWDKSVMGTPDVVYMVYGLPSADAIDYLSYYSSPNAEDAPYFGADDDPEEAQSKALGRNGGIMFEGYDWDRRMSRNAVSAYEKGLAPLHKWTKAAISSVISAGASQEIADVLTKGLPTTALHDLFLRYSEWHHTGMRFSQTDFYRFNNSQLDGIETVADARKIVDAYKAYAELEKIRAGLEGKRITATYTDASGRKVTEGGVYSHYRFTPDSAVSEAERKVAEKIADMPGWLKEFLGRFKSYGAVGNDSSLSGKIYEPGRKPNRSQYDDPGYFRVGETRISGGFRPFSLQEWDGKAWVTKEEYDGRTNEVLDAWFHIPGSNVEWVDDFTSDSIPQELVEAEKPYVDAMNANMMDDDGGGKAKSDMMRYAFPIDSQRVVKADSDGITSEDRSENGDVLLVGGNNADGKSYLNDYKAALVPSYMPDNDKEILRSHGLDVVPYGIGERDSALIKYLDGNGTNETSGEQSGSNGLMFEPTQEENEQYTKEWYADVQKAVEEHFLVPDEVLEKFKGEDWADREMRFRATLVLPENQWWFEEAMAADDFDAYVDALNKKQTDEGKEPFDINLQEHSGEDYDWAKRIWDYAHLKSPVQKDREFVKNMTADRSTMISYAKTLRGYLVPQAGKRKKNGTVIYGQRYVYNSWPGVSTKVSRLTYSSTEEEVEAAKELVRANPHPYRRAFDYSVRQTQEAKETAAGGAYSSYGQEEYLENVGDNALDAWRAVERDAAKRELQKLREEKRNVKLGDLGVTDKTVKTVTEEEKKNPDIKDATAAKDATQEQATVKEATLTDKRLAKAKRKIKELKQTLADTEQELSATSDEYDDLLKSLGIADKESSDKIDFLKAYGKEKARQAKDLEEKLADRRNRVSELRSQLTDANEELRKTTSHSETLQNRLDTIKAKQVVAGLRSILKRVSSQNDSVDANVYDAFFLIHDRLLKDKGTGLVDIETDVLHYDYESAINQISYYVASTEGASHNIVNHLVDGDSLSAWTPQELADLASVLSDMRKDAQVSLARKKMERMQRLHDEAYVLYREITGQNGSLTYDDQMDVWLLNNDVVDNIKKKKDNALEGFSLAFSKMQRVARVVDGNREGVVYDRFVRKAWESNMQELRGVSKRLDAADKEMKRLKITDDWLAQEIYTYKSGATDVTLTRGQVIGLYVYSKNEVERAKLVAKQGNNISSADLASALALLSDNDKAWGDYMINDFAQNRERVADTYYQVYNRLLGWRENYFTMIGDGKIGDGEQDILDGPQQQKKRYVNKSMTKEIAERALYPLKLDVTQSWISQVRKEEHFVAFADWSRDSQHLLQGSGAMGTIIQTKYGKHMLDTFQHYTNDVGSPNTMMTNMEQTLNRVISRGAVAMLSYNLLTTIKQLPAVMAAFGQVGVGEFYKAGVELITDRKRTLDMIYEKAPDIRDRYISQDVQRAVETKAANKVDKVIKGVGEVGLQPVQFFDQAVATQLWYAAYLTNLNKGLSEQEAVFKASQLISETQNTNQVTDLSEIQRTRNPFTRSAFLFTNQLMQYYNMWRYDIGFYRANGQKGKMWGTVANILLNAGVMALVSGALLKRPSDDDDKDKWRRFATQYIGELLGQALPLVGSMIQEGMEGFSGSFISLFSSVGQMIKVAMSEDKGEGEKKERMKSSMKDLIVDGLAFAGAPATAGKRVILAISDSDWYYLFGTDWGKYGPGTFGNQE